MQIIITGVRFVKAKLIIITGVRFVKAKLIIITGVRFVKAKLESRLPTAVVSIAGSLATMENGVVTGWQMEL